jgi:hypothetical protein
VTEWPWTGATADPQPRGPAGPAPADTHQRHWVTFRGPRPTITVLCGSTRFYDAFREQNLLLTLAGHIVLSIGCDTKRDGDLTAAGVLGPGLKDRLNVLHRRKIDLADEVLVVSDESGYYGDSTRSEIAYARGLGKPVRFVVPHAEEI